MGEELKLDGDKVGVWALESAEGEVVYVCVGRNKPVVGRWERAKSESSKRDWLLAQRAGGKRVRVVLLGAFDDWYEARSAWALLVAKYVKAGQARFNLVGDKTSRSWRRWMTDDELDAIERVARHDRWSVSMLAVEAIDVDHEPV